MIGAYDVNVAATLEVYAEQRAAAVASESNFLEGLG